MDATHMLVLVLMGVGTVIAACCGESNAAPSDRIQPYVRSPRYWQYKGEPLNSEMSRPR